MPVFLKFHGHFLPERSQFIHAIVSDHDEDISALPSGKFRDSVEFNLEPGSVDGCGRFRRRSDDIRPLVHMISKMGDRQV